MTREQAVSLAVSIVIRESRKNGCSPVQQIEEWSGLNGGWSIGGEKVWYSRTGLQIRDDTDEYLIIWPIVKKALESSDQMEMKF